MTQNPKCLDPAHITIPGVRTAKFTGLAHKLATCRRDRYRGGMLSYQHAYHAGNAADVHKHALLAVIVDYMTGKSKPLTYIETHAGRGLYDLDGSAAQKTGEAAAGVDRLLTRLPVEHPYVAALSALRAIHGPRSYPGSPLIAARMLRATDRLHLAELHPGEHAALARALPHGGNIRLEHRDGFELARALTPPEPRRGLMLIDPSWEVREDYALMTRLLPALHRKWGVGVLMLWYPLLPDRRHAAMTESLRAAIPDLMVHEVGFPSARPGHGLIGSGMAIVNAPWGTADRAARLATIFTNDGKDP